MVEPWIEGLWSPLSSLLLPDLPEATSTPGISVDAGTELNSSSSRTADLNLLDHAPEIHTDGASVTLEGKEVANESSSEFRTRSRGHSGDAMGSVGTTDGTGEGGGRQFTESSVDGAAQNISQLVEVEVTALMESSGKESEKLNEHSGVDKAVVDSVAVEVVSTLLSDLLQNFHLFESSPLNSMSAMGSHQEIVYKSADLIDESCDQSFKSALKTRLTGLTAGSLSLPTIPHAYLRLTSTKVCFN